MVVKTQYITSLSHIMRGYINIWLLFKMPDSGIKQLQLAIALLINSLHFQGASLL